MNGGTVRTVVLGAFAAFVAAVIMYWIAGIASEDRAVVKNESG